MRHRRWHCAGNWPLGLCPGGCHCCGGHRSHRGGGGLRGCVHEGLGGPTCCVCHRLGSQGLGGEALCSGTHGWSGAGCGVAGGVLGRALSARGAARTCPGGSSRLSAGGQCCQRCCSWRCAVAGCLDVGCAGGQSWPRGQRGGRRWPRGRLGGWCGCPGGHAAGGTCRSCRSAHVCPVCSPCCDCRRAVVGSQSPFGQCDGRRCRHSFRRFIQDAMSFSGRTSCD